MKKRTFGKGLFLCLAVLLGLLIQAAPRTAEAAGDPESNAVYYVYADGYSLGDTEGTYYVQATHTVTFDSSSSWNVHYHDGTLHLRNYHGGKIVMLGGHDPDVKLQILLEGSNSVTATDSAGIAAGGLAVDIESVNSSNGSLEIHVVNTEATYTAGIDNCYAGSNSKAICIKSGADVAINTIGKRSFGIKCGGNVSVEGTARLDVNTIYNNAGSSDSVSAAVYSMNGKLAINTIGAVNLSAASRSVSLGTNYGYAFYSGGGTGASYFSCAVNSFPYVSLSSVGYQSKISNVGSVASGSYSGLIKTYKQSATFESLLLEKTSGQLPITGGTFPDPSFRAFVRNKYDTNRNGLISDDEIQYMKTITITDDDDSKLYNDAYSLAGIEYLTELTHLTWDPDASDTGSARGNLVELDLRHNTKLKIVTVRNNRLRELYIAGLTQLTWLDAAGNLLHGPLASSLPALTDLLLRGNMLTDLNVSGAPKLNYLDCGENSLAALDLSANPKLRFLYCDNNKLSSLDLTKQTALGDLVCGGNLFTSLDLTKNTALTWLSVSGSRLTSLSVSRNTALVRLDCSGSTSLKSLSLGTNPNLRWLRCFNTALTGLRVSTCSVLKNTVTGGSRRTLSEDGFSFLEYYTEDEYGSTESCVQADPGTNVFYTVTGSTYSYSGVDRYFSAFATCGNPGSISYRWQYRTSSSGTWKDCSSAMEGYRLATMKVPAVLWRNGYQYRCRVANSYGRTAYSPAVTLYVIGIKSHPADVSTTVDQSVSFKVTASGGGLRYQWQYKYPGESWQNSGYASAKTAKLTFTTVQKYNGLQYRCKVTDAAGNSVYSNTALLSVLKQQPVSVSAKVGATVSFTAVGYGSGLKYQWQYQYPGESWQNSGYGSAKTSKLSFSALAKYNGLKYRCLITDANGTTVRSRTVTLTILPAITGQPKNTSAAAGGTAKFTVTATGAGLKYQWQYQYPGESWKNSGYASAKTAVLSVPALSKYNGLKYRCVVTDANGKTVTSSAATLTVR